MKLLRDLEELVGDEIQGVRRYARMAAELKAEHPGLAQVLYTISTQEETHQAAIHTEAVKIIEEYKRTHGAPPPAMIAVYEYMHKKHIDSLAEARRYQDIYKGS